MNILSFVFVIFMIILISLMFIVKQEKVRQIILLAANYIFYAYADYRYLGILLAQTLIAHCTARLIVQKRKNKNSPKLIFITGIVCCIGILLVWKYSVYWMPYINIQGGGIF